MRVEQLLDVPPSADLSINWLFDTLETMLENSEDLGRGDLQDNMINNAHTVFSKALRYASEYVVGPLLDADASLALRDQLLPNTATSITNYLTQCEQVSATFDQLATFLPALFGGGGGSTLYGEFPPTRHASRWESNACSG